MMTMRPAVPAKKFILRKSGLRAYFLSHWIDNPLRDCLLHAPKNRLEPRFSRENFLAGTTVRRLLIIYVFLLIAYITPPLHAEKAYYPSLTYDEWQAIAPYLLPDTHPVKSELDALFSRSRITTDLEAFRMAGFITKGPGQWSSTVVARHPKLKGVILKLFFDSQSNIDEYKKLMNRIHGAERAEEIITEHKWHHLFKVPRKWIYLLPSPPHPEPASSYPKYFILVAEDMGILPRKENYARWRSKWITPSFLDTLFILLTEGGFYDAVYAFNLPFSKDGRIALIDLEEHDGWPIPYFKLNRYLTGDMIAYWNLLIEKGGP